MKKSRRKKNHSFKRKLITILYVFLYTIIAFCVGLTIYIILCEEGVISLSSNHPIEKREISKNNVANMQEEIRINKEDNLEKQKIKRDIDIRIELDVASKKENAKDTKIIPIQIIGKVDQENIRIIEEQLKLLPVELVDAFLKDENHWNFYITDEDIRDKYYAGKGSRCMGVTVYDYHQIEVENRADAAENAPIHEMGHFLDYEIRKTMNMNQYPSLTPEFIQIYEKEANQFMTNIENGGCVSNSREFFAETFYYYVKDSSKCTPEAAEYIQSQLNILRSIALK